MEPKNSKSFIKSKFFWASAIVILLIASITLYIFEEKEKALRIYTQGQLIKTVKEKNLIEDRLLQTVKSKEKIEEELIAEKEISQSLEEELKEEEHQMRLTLEKLEKEETARRRAEAHLIIALEGKRILETRLRGTTRRPKTVNLDGIIVKPTSILVGNVLAVNEEHGFIVVDLGRMNHIDLGDILSVYRNDEFIGRVRVEKIEERISAATILPDWQGAEFKEKDEVRGI